MAVSRNLYQHLTTSDHPLSVPNQVILLGIASGVVVPGGLPFSKNGMSYNMNDLSVGKPGRMAQKTRVERVGNLRGLGMKLLNMECMVQTSPSPDSESLGQSDSDLPEFGKAGGGDTATIKLMDCERLPAAVKVRRPTATVSHVFP